MKNPIIEKFVLNYDAEIGGLLPAEADFLRENLPSLIKSVVLEALPPENKDKGGYASDIRAKGFNSFRSSFLERLGKELGV